MTTIPAPRTAADDTPPRCHQHSLRVWLASCPDCTRYHLHQAGVSR